MPLPVVVVSADNTETAPVYKSSGDCQFAARQNLGKAEYTLWVDRLRGWEEYLIQIGGCIARMFRGGSAGIVTSPEFLVRHVAHMFDGEKDNENTFEFLRDVFARDSLKDSIKAWDAGVKEFAAAPDSGVYALLALRSMMVCLADASADWGRTDEGHHGGGINVGADIKGFGGTSGTGSSKRYHFKIAERIHVRVLPYIELIDWFILKQRAVSRLTESQIVEMYNVGTLERADAVYMLGLHGVPEDAALLTLQTAREQPSVDEWIGYARRNDYDESAILKGLKQRGYTRDDEARTVLAMYDELPNISDVLIFLRRNVFDEDYINTFHLTEGFEDRFWAKFGRDLRAQGILKETARLHYAAHWIVPPPGELASALQRLRPGRVAEDVTVTQEQYLLALAEQDVAPFWRKRFLELAYKTLGLRFLKQLYYTSQIDAEELTRRYEDLGYRRSDAEIIVASEAIQKARTRATNGHGFSVPTLRRLYLEGLISDDDCRTEMAKQGYTVSEIEDFLQAARLDRKNALRKTRIQAVTTSYRRGLIDLMEARGRLSRLEIAPDQVAALVELMEARGQAAASKVKAKAAVQDKRMGLLDDQQFHDALVEAGLNASQRERIYERTVQAEELKESAQSNHAETNELRDQVTALTVYARMIQEEERYYHREEARQREALATRRRLRRNTQDGMA